MPAMLAALALSGCGGGGGGGDQPAAVPSATTMVSAAASSAQSPATSGLPATTGSPVTAVTAGELYDFRPTSSSAIGFRIVNKPHWAAFDTGTGELRGTPTFADIGMYNDIVITYGDGSAVSSLPKFSVYVAAGESRVATLSWSMPLENIDHSPLVDLAGYRIYGGQDPSALAEVAEVPPSWRAYLIPQLATGTWYFAMTSFNEDGDESALSEVVSKTFDF